jgi:hypothetical protein
VDHTRHMNIFQVPEDFSVTLVGAGGIGATTALTLAKMGVCTMVVYDDDTVGHENIPTQLHRVSDVGIDKVDSLELTLREYSDELTYFGRNSRVTESDTIRSSLVISAVDNISARQGIWKALNNPESAWDFYLDARMAAEEFQMFVVCRDDPEAMAYYEAHLMGMDEGSAPDLPCTAKATFHCAMISAGHIGTQLRNIVRGEVHSHRLVHNIPANFLQEFSL